MPWEDDGICQVVPQENDGMCCATPQILPELSGTTGRGWDVHAEPHEEDGIIELCQCGIAGYAAPHKKND
jgi:hypothetical protein